MINDLIYSKETLYVTLKGKYDIKGIDRLNEKIRYIVNEYSILKVVIDTSSLIECPIFIYDDNTNNIMVS